MGKDFLNNEEYNKINIIKQFIKSLDTTKYNNRFDNFDNRKQIIDWVEIQDYINVLSQQIKDKNYIGIYGIPRGGLILATLLSYKTGLPLLSAPSKNCLIMDDDASTGVTLLPYIGRFDVALMYKNPDCSITPTYLYKEYDDVYKTFIWNEENNN